MTTRRRPPAPPASPVPAAPALEDRLLRIQKYPNRRLYDRTGSRHLTTEELHALVVDGWRVQINDSRTGEDITNVILAQLLLERDPLKLGAFPPEFLHLLIRSSHRTLPSVHRAMIEATAALARGWAGWSAWSEPMRNLLAAGGQVPPLAALADWLVPTDGRQARQARREPLDDAATPGNPQAQHPADVDAELRRLERELARVRALVQPRQPRERSVRRAAKTAGAQTHEASARKVRDRTAKASVGSSKERARATNRRPAKTDR